MTFETIAKFIILGLVFGGLIFTIIYSIINCAIMTYRGKTGEKKYKEFYDLINEYFKEKILYFDFINKVDSYKQDIQLTKEKLELTPSHMITERLQLSKKIEDTKMQIYLYNTYKIPSQKKKAISARKNAIEIAKQKEFPERIWKGYVRDDD